MESRKIVGLKKIIKFLCSTDFADDLNKAPIIGKSPSKGTLFTDSWISSLIRPPNTKISPLSAKTVVSISLLFVIKSDEFGSCDPAILDTSCLIKSATESASFICGLTSNLIPISSRAREEIGIKLEVKPQINEADSVALFIRQEVSSIAGSQLPNSSDLITNKREIETTVLADNGEILVLGGLISEDIQESVNKVPLLGDLPIIGALFRSSAKSVEQRNLMIFLRPTILRDSITTKDLSEEKFNLIRAKQLLKEEETSD